MGLEQLWPALRSLVMRYTTSTVFLLFSVTVRSSWRPERYGRTRSMEEPVRPGWCPRPAAVVRAHGRHRGDSGPGQLLQLPLERGHVGLTVITWPAPVGDELTYRGEPRPENPVRTSALTRAKARRKVDSSARRGPAEPGEHLRARVGGPLPDRGERQRPREHRRDPDGEKDEP